MIIPMNFAVGALVGAAAAYVYKDESAKDAIGTAGAKLKGLLKKKADPVEEQEILEAVDIAEAEAEVKAEDVKDEEVDVVKKTTTKTTTKAKASEKS